MLCFCHACNRRPQKEQAMDSMLESRPLVAEDERLIDRPSNRDSARTYVPSSEPARFSTLDIVAGVLTAVMMIGPLAAAAIGRMMT
jgi:hypothetical protein